MAELEVNPGLQFPAQGTVLTTLPLLLHSLAWGQPLANIQKGEITGLTLIGVI